MDYSVAGLILLLVYVWDFLYFYKDLLNYVDYKQKAF